MMNDKRKVLQTGLLLACRNEGATPDRGNIRTAMNTPGGMAPANAPGKAAKANDNPERFQYYYHGDHLGSTSLITNLDGEVVQHVEYVPFGEVFLEERNNRWNTSYLFNAKELDEETGLYYYGARYYDPRTSVWLSTDPWQEKYPNVSTYAYCNNNPINFIDPDGNFPILVNGRVGNNSERGSATYWNTGILSTISTQTDYAQSAFMFVDGDKGFWANTRLNAGITQGTADAAGVFARLKGSMVDGQITEQLQFVTHSRGSAFGNGYMQGLSAEVQKLATAEGIGFAYGADNIVEYSVNLAPHQSNWINYPNSGATNVNVSHIGDPLSGNDATGNVINVQSIPFRDSGPITQHSTGSFIRELGFILNVLENFPQSSFLQAIKAAYKNYDASRTNGDRSNVTP